MSDTPPNKQTASVPLKKETIRVTLKASDLPPARPGAPAPTAPPVPKPTKRLGTAAAPTAKATTRVAPAIPKPKPSAPLGTERVTTPPTPAPTAKMGTAKITTTAAPTAKTITAKATPPTPTPTAKSVTAKATPPTPGAPPAPKPVAPPAPKPTVKIAQAGSNPPLAKPSVIQEGAPKATALPTLKLGGNTPLGTAQPQTPQTGPGTSSLPQATMALNPPTQPLTPVGRATAQAAVVTTTEDDEDGQDLEQPQPFLTVLSGVAAAAALLVLFLQYSLASVWMNAVDNATKGISQLF